jgi:TonB dependent receptor/TonB-dependent Receptor Plug Domain
VRYALRPLPCALAALLVHTASHADDFVIQRVLVEGARASQLGIADSASSGSVGASELALHTPYRPGELLEAVPGLMVSQHSGEGKANQFYLRGFNLDHGTDLATWVDGMPVNQRSHAHGQGWTDLNFLIPEITARLDYAKGPYSARQGDFASAGSASITYANRLVQDVASVTLGQDGFARTALAASPALAGGNLLYAVELLHKDGPFTRPDDYQKTNGVLRYSRGYANNGWSVTAMAYHGRWNATDQLPRRAVQAGALGRFDTLDPSDGGVAQRISVSGVWRRTGADSASKLSAYVIRNRLDLYSNFTYFLDDPLNGDQFGQPDRRVTTGLDALHTWHVHRAGTMSSDLTVGLQAQGDNVFNGLYDTRQRQRLSATREDHVAERSGGAYVENVTHWNASFRTVAGVRADRYRFDVRSNLAQNSGRTGASLASPSLSLVFGPWSRTEFYANFGNGFHSNDARGTVAAVDPKTGDAIDRAPGLVRSRGAELGVRSEAIPKMQTLMSLYRLDFDSELTFVGDEGTTQAGPPSRRYGIEFSNYYKPLKWLSVDLDAAFAHARSRGYAGSGSRMPGAVEGVGQFAVTVDRLGPWSGALRLRYLGARPLVENDSVRSGASLALNGRVAYRHGKDLRVELEGFNLTNRHDPAVEYYYVSRLHNEEAPRADVHLRPIEPRSLRITLVKNW